MKPKSPHTIAVLAALVTSGSLFAQTVTDVAQPRLRARRHHFQPRAFTPPPGPASFGDPLPGLTPEQLAIFAAGKDEFESVEDIAGGLGPIFNNVSCVSCHASAATGGAGPVTVTRFGRMENGVYDPLENLGGSLLQAHAIDVNALENVPLEANVLAHRESTPLFGLGLVEAIPDADILAGVRTRAYYGIRGRAAKITDVVSGETRVGRFGWKAQQATLLAFAADAYLNEMGVTSRFFPTENAPNGDTPKLAAFDNLLDPEDEVDPLTGKGDIDASADFMRFLGAPPPVALTPAATAGAKIFNRIYCAACHRPTFQTGPNAIAALDQKTVPLYSDLLLHDMGLLGDGIDQADAAPHEMKTAPLWGLRASGPYLHDGRAATIDDAIRGHDGEAALSRDRYKRLPKTQRAQLLEFLNSI